MLISPSDACNFDPWPNHTSITSSTAGMDIAIAMTTARKPSDVRATLRIGRSTLQVQGRGLLWQDQQSSGDSIVNKVAASALNLGIVDATNSCRPVQMPTTAYHTHCPQAFSHELGFSYTSTHLSARNALSHTM